MINAFKKVINLLKIKSLHYIQNILGELFGVKHSPKKVAAAFTQLQALLRGQEIEKYDRVTKVLFCGTLKAK